MTTENYNNPISYQLFTHTLETIAHCTYGTRAERNTANNYLPNNTLPLKQSLEFSKCIFEIFSRRTLNCYLDRPNTVVV